MGGPGTLRTPSRPEPLSFRVRGVPHDTREASPTDKLTSPQLIPSRVKGRVFRVFSHPRAAPHGSGFFFSRTMDSWDGYNYYTTNSTEWIVLMNLSTSEWDIGFLPPHVVAIPGPFNSSYNFSADTLVIENASRAEFGSRDIEQVIFGAASGLIIAWAILFLAWHLKRGTLFKPRASSSHPTDDDENTLPLHANRNFLSATEFRKKLDIVYDSEDTELELYKRGIRGDGVSSEDIEVGTELLRKMYKKDLQVWASQSAVEYSQQDRLLWMDQSDSLLAELRSLVGEWNTRRPGAAEEWTREEQQELNTLVKMLSELPQTRYPTDG